MDSDKWTKSDFIVITTYWSSEFLHCFVEPWVDLHAEVFSDEEKHSGIALHSSILFFSQYILALFIALHVDLNNHRLQISAGAMLIYLTIPLFGLFLHSWSAAQLIMMRCGLAVHVIVKAVRFSGIFTQPPGPNGDNTRLATAMNETLVSVVGCITYFVLQNNPRSLSLTSLIAIWFSLFVAISSVLVAHYVIRNMVRRRTIEEDTVHKIIDGIKNDPRGKQYKYLPAERAHSAFGLGLFLVIVLMFSTVSITEVIINNAYLQDGEEGVSDTNQLIAAAIQLFIVPLIGLLFALFKGKCGIIAEGTLLTLVYLANIMSLYSSVMSQETPTQTERLLSGIGNKTGCVVHPGFLEPSTTGVFFDIADNVGPISVQVGGKMLNVTEASPYHRPHINLERHELGIDIQVQIRTSDGPKKSFRNYFPRVQYYSLVYRLTEIEVNTYLTSRTIPMEVNETIIFFFLNVNAILPVHEEIPKIVVESQGKILKEMESPPLKDGYTVNVTVPRYSSYNISCINCACGESQTFNWTIHESIYKLFFYAIEELRYKDAAKLVEYCHPVHSSFILAGANCTNEDAKPVVVRDPTLVASSFAFKSVALTSALVSFINFYWSESPNRLRTTTMAAAFAVNDGLEALTDYVFPYVSSAITYTFISFNVIAGLIHVSLFIFYLYYYTKEDVDMDLLDDEYDESLGRSYRSRASTFYGDDDDDEEDQDEQPKWWNRFFK